MKEPFEYDGIVAYKPSNGVDLEASLKIDGKGKMTLRFKDGAHYTGNRSKDEKQSKWILTSLLGEQMFLTYGPTKGNNKAFNGRHRKQHTEIEFDNHDVSIEALEPKFPDWNIGDRIVVKYHEQEDAGIYIGSVKKIDELVTIKFDDGDSDQFNRKETITKDGGIIIGEGTAKKTKRSIPKKNLNVFLKYPY